MVLMRLHHFPPPKRESHQVADLLIVVPVRSSVEPDYALTTMSAIVNDDDNLTGNFQSINGTTLFLNRRKKVNNNEMV